MKLTPINPWQWQDNLGYAQAIEVKHSEGTLYCAGQAAMNAEGQPVGGSMNEQIDLSFKNLHTVITKAGYKTANIVRLNFYTTYIADFFKAYGHVVAWMKTNHCLPASTLIQVESLAFPELTIEIEATVVK